MVRFDIFLEFIVRKIAIAIGLSEVLVYSLRTMEIFESSRSTDNIRRSSMKKGILEPIIDDLGKQTGG